MPFRFLAACAALILIAGVLVAVVDSGRRASGRSGPSPNPSAAGASAPAADSTASAPTPQITPSSPSPYTFEDEFDGSSLSLVWQRHFRCCGTLAGMDPSLTTVADGFLSMTVDRRDNGWYGDLIDTKSTWTQLYGYFEARIKVPKGAGLWPAFWSYFTGDGTQAEIDMMEICGGDSGTGQTVLNNAVHWSSKDAENHPTIAPDLTTDFHVYAVDWRSDNITFFLDGTPIWTFRDADHIPNVPLPLILDLGVGGKFCGPPDSTTPDGAQMVVDWVRAKP